MLKAVPFPYEEWPGGGVAEEFGDKPALTNPSFTGDQDNAARAVLRGTPRLVERFCLAPASNQYGRNELFGHTYPLPKSGSSPAIT